MYEKPKLNRVGDARDVILGVAPTGNDLDANWISGYFEFAPEGDTQGD
jgi:hypothetical protein